MRRPNKLLLLTLIVSLCLAGYSQEASAAQTETLSLQGQHLATPYTQVPIYIDGLLMDKACLKDGELYFSPAVICSWLDIDWSWQGDENNFTLTLDGIDFTGDSSMNYLTGNGRYFYAPQGWFVANDRLYLPYDLLCRYLCLDAYVAEDYSSLSLSTLNAQIIPGGDDYYELNYSNDDIFWMSQIIHAESWQQPMAGQIGVGNVVLNRVAAEQYPDTIFDVIFDMQGVVQFEPVTNGSVYSTPDEQSIIAAYLCMDGYNTVGDSLYFVNPTYGSDWFDSSLKFNLSIGDHNFYTNWE
jgi:N-acetylmuramoyl-L-alanine amidase